MLDRRRRIPRPPLAWSKFVAFIGVAILAVMGSIVLSSFGRAGYEPPPVAPVATLGPEVVDPVIVKIPSESLADQGTKLLSETSSGAATLPVDAIFVSSETGSDANDGLSMEQPLASLQQALNAVRPGQTVLVMNGTYHDTAEPGVAHHVLATSGEPAAWVRVQNAPGHTPVIVATEGNGLEVRGSYVEVQGLTIEGRGFTEASEWGAGVLVRSSHHVRLLANRISGLPLNGISVVEGSNIAILDNVIFENSFWSTAQGSGISVWHSRNHGFPAAADGYHDRIMGNILYRNENMVESRWRNFEVVTDGNGIIIDQNHHFGYDGRTLVANNLIFDNGGRGVIVFESSFVDIMHNTSYHNGRTTDLDGGPTELAATRAHEVRFINNLAWARPDTPALLVDEATDVSSVGNMFITNNDDTVASDDDTELTSSPSLRRPSVNEFEADFRPRSNSALAAYSLPASPSLSYDVIGVRRDPVAPTVGAYEITAELP